MAGKIFINYRRDDERATAARIRDRLANTFGERNVFMDVDNLQPGQRFDKELEMALTQCDVFIAVIGTQWANLLAERQATSEHDFVVDEIAAAIARQIPVIPVLVDGAPLPPAEVLPPPIAALPLHQTHEVKHESFGRDIEALIAAIRAGRKPVQGGQGRSRRKATVATLLVAIVIAGGVGGYFVYRQLEAERQRVQALADERAKRIAHMKREAEEGRRKAEADEERRAEAERKRKEAERKRLEAEKRRKAEAERKRAEKEARRRAEGRIKVLVGLPGREQARWLKPGAGKTEWFKDCLHCPDLVVAPAGNFQMGSNHGEKHEKPVHTVTITSPFAVGRFEVTFAEWDACLAAGGCKHNPGDQGWGRGRRPVINVSREDAKEYVAWLSGMTGKQYRLLSEAEWEYVARAGSTSPFWWGKSISTGQANYDGNFTHGGGPKGEFRQRTVIVDRFAPNPWGVYQVHGNVMEWVADCWNKSYIGAPTDGSPWTSGECHHPVSRDGGFGHPPALLRSASRSWHITESGSNIMGFRVARTL